MSIGMDQEISQIKTTLDSFSKINETDAKIVETGQKCLELDGALLNYTTVNSKQYSNPEK